MPFVSFSCIIELAGTFSTMLNTEEDILVFFLMMGKLDLLSFNMILIIGFP